MEVNMKTKNGSKASRDSESRGVAISNKCLYTIVHARKTKKVIKLNLCGK